MADTNQEKIDKMPVILKALEPMCFWEIPKKYCDKEILFYRVQYIEFFMNYFSNWLDKKGE